MSTRLFARLAGPALAVAALLGPSAAAAQAAFQASGQVFAVQVTSWRDLPFRRVIRQQYDYSCGSAALATLLRYHYGLDVGEAAVFRAMYATGDQAKIRKVGFSLLDMKTYLAHLGLSSDGYRIGWDQLAASTEPSIAVISAGPYRHFVVVKGVSADQVLIGDPATGLKAYSRGDFERVWNHIIFAVHGDGRVKAAFNQAQEWPARGPRAFGAALSVRQLQEAIDLPTIFQVTQLRP